MAGNDISTLTEPNRTENGHSKSKSDIANKKPINFVVHKNKTLKEFKAKYLNVLTLRIFWRFKKATNLN